MTATESALREELDKLCAEFESFKDHAAAQFAACQLENAKLSTAVGYLSAQVEKLSRSNDELQRHLLDLTTGRVDRADKRFALLLDKVGGPVGKGIAAIAGLVLTGLASWWAGRLGLGLPVTQSPPAPAPVVIEGGP
jgi:hypothetical protein